MKHFDLRELVDKKTYEDHGENAWRLLDADLLDALDELREVHGRPIYCNNWDSGGPLQWRGYRPSYCPVGVRGSMHRLGKALDLTLSGLTADEARELVRVYHAKGALQSIRRIELDVSWLHIDALPTGKRELVTFKPAKSA